MLLVNPVIKILDEVLLRVEVVVSIPQRHTGLLRDCAHCCLFIATLAKHLQGGFQNERFRLVALQRLVGYLFAGSTHEVTSRRRQLVQSGIDSARLVKLHVWWWATTRATTAGTPTRDTGIAPTRP